MHRGHLRKVERKNDTKTKFSDNLDKQLGKVVNVIKQSLDYIARNEEHNKVEHKLYSAKTLTWPENIVTKIHYEDGYSFERYMDARFPYLYKAEYKKQNPIRNDKSYLNNTDDFLT